MTNIYIDFSKTNPVFGNTLAGHVGEHNATNLIITPPKSMSEDNRIINYAVSFETEGGERYKSDIYTKSATVETPLYSQLTTDDILYIQLEGYGQNKNVIVKSDVVFIRLGSSLGNDGVAVDSSVKPQENIIQFGWVPENKEVLESFNKKDESKLSYITFDGERLALKDEFLTKALLNSFDYDFRTGTSARPSTSSTYFNIYCYDFPTGYQIEDVHISYVNSEGNRKNHSFKKWHQSNYLTFEPSSNTTNTGYMAKITRKSSSFTFNSINDVKNLIEHIGAFGTVSVTVEYRVKTVY